MIKEHQVPSQLDQWEAEARAGIDPFLLDQGIRAGYFGVVHRKALRLAFAAGADQELDQCVQWLISNQNPRWAAALQEGRRPKLSSLKAQALAALETQFAKEFMESDERDIIRRALEALPD